MERSFEPGEHRGREGKAEVADSSCQARRDSSTEFPGIRPVALENWSNAFRRLCTNDAADADANDAESLDAGANDSILESNDALPKPHDASPICLGSETHDASGH